jgi:hypothetical protein
MRPAVLCEHSKALGYVHNVIPAQAGIQGEALGCPKASLDSRLRGNDTAIVARCEC